MMLEFLAEYGLFLAKTLTVLAFIVAVVGLVGSMGQKAKKHAAGHLEVRKLNKEFEGAQDNLRHVVLEPEVYKKEVKNKEKEEKKAKKERKKELKNEEAEDSSRKRLYVLDFDGDIKASAVSGLREEITAVLGLARPQDEVLVRLESPGGIVPGYGLAASQLVRIRNKKIHLTVAVDKVAASGGYMMACNADKIIAAPFAVLGSIGVIAQLPNFNRLLKKHDVDIEMHTAGEYKRTLTMFGENTEKGRQKFLEDLEDTHVLFKEFVSEQRPQLDIEKVATGEIWYGRKAVEEQLVDEIMTSDEYIMDRLEDYDIFQIKHHARVTVAEKLGLATGAMAERLLTSAQSRLAAMRFFN
ncbi:protease SohB [Endozoicomonadaceae bacterium StTr2]